MQDLESTEHKVRHTQDLFFVNHATPTTATPTTKVSSYDERKQG